MTGTDTGAATGAATATGAGDPAGGRIALVTGASRGLGAALAEELAGRGWHVVAVARTQGALEELDDRVRAAQGAGGNGDGGITLAPADLTDEDAVRRLCRAVHDRWGGIGLWAHAAIHGGPLSPAGSIDGKDLDRAIALNLRGTALLIAMVEPLLRAGDGTALFFDDPRPGSVFAGAYGATKSAQIALARAWQREGARIGPRVVIGAPLPMATRLRSGFHPGEDRALLASPADEAARLLDRVCA